jgi:hypothetical protein
MGEGEREEKQIKISFSIKIYSGPRYNNKMAHLFCCTDIEGYRPRYLDHESKFTSFMAWAAFPRASSPGGNANSGVDLSESKPAYAVQLVRQVNYGPLESKRYFVPLGGGSGGFAEITESDLIQANFQKLNS